MSIDFEIPAEAKAIREKVRKWVQDECIPAEKELDTKSLDEVLGPLRKKARAQGLWCPFIPKEYGGMGLGPLANALVQMELGESSLGALSLNTQGPDDATMLTLLAHGTEYQKEKFLKPLLDGEKRVCFSMTEKAAGADATGMQTTRGQGRQRELCPQRREVVLIVGQRRRHRHRDGEDRSERAAPPAVLDLHRRAAEPGLPDQAQHPDHGDRGPALRPAVRRPLRDRHQGPEVPADNLLGGEGNGFNMGQHRLAYGRLRHGMHNIAMAQRALDMATARVTKRSTFGKLLAERQAVQFMLADCASELYIARLMLLHIAYKAEKGMDLRQENSIAKVFLAHMVHKVVDTAIQLHGALGYSQDTPLARWYTQIRSQRLVDGPDEVHQWTVGRNVIKAYKEHGTTASAAGGDLI